jgi:phage tail-like protein
MSATDQAKQPMTQLLAESHVAFRYVVEIGKQRMGVFTECDLPTIEWETEEVREGGLNTHVHVLPGRRKAARFTLKHGIGRGQLIEWYKKALENQFQARNVTIALQDVAGNIVATWVMNEAYPIKWTGPQLKADSNTVAIQSIEFACGQVTVDIGG